MNRLNAVMASIEWSVRQRQIETTAALIRELGQSLEALRPVLAPLAYQKQWLRGQIDMARLQWIREGEPTAAETFVTLLPAAEKLVASNPEDKEAVRLGVNFCQQAGQVLLADRPADPRTGRVLGHGVEWAEQLVRLDLSDQRSRMLTASAMGTLGDYVRREDPRSRSGSAPAGRRPIVGTDAFLAHQLRHAGADRGPQRSTACERWWVSAGSRRRRTICGGVLEFYDPLMMLGMKVARSGPVHEIQATAWVAQAGVTAGKGGSAWYQDAGRRGISRSGTQRTIPLCRRRPRCCTTIFPGFRRSARAGGAGGGPVKRWWRNFRATWLCATRRRFRRTYTVARAALISLTSASGAEGIVGFDAGKHQRHGEAVFGNPLRRQAYPWVSATSHWRCSTVVQGPHGSGESNRPHPPA